eukprot:11554935-Alexandrium_andersonii.AAC.1
MSVESPLAIGRPSWRSSAGALLGTSFVSKRLSIPAGSGCGRPDEAIRSTPSRWGGGVLRWSSMHV